MAVDPPLLEKARAAGSRLVELEHGVMLARADYHIAIRRLHLAGATLREIAQALSLSHQRVQQVVRAAGGSWWQVWRRRSQARDAVCTWCERSPSEVASLIAGPHVFICDACVADAERVAKGTRVRRTDLYAAGTRTRQRCDFCSRRASGVRSLVIGPANVCSDCLHVCREILNERAA